jgi:hypothetical protein
MYEMNPNKEFFARLVTEFTRNAVRSLDTVIHGYSEMVGNIDSRGPSVMTSGDNYNPDPFQSPITAYVGTEMDPENIEARVVYDAPQPFVIITAEEKPNDILGSKVREVLALPIGCKVTRTEFDKRTGELSVFTEFPETQLGQKIPVDIKQEGNRD